MLEGIPSKLAISYIDIVGAVIELRTDDIEVLSGPRSDAKVLQQCSR